MTGDAYRKELLQKPVPVLYALYKHLFLTPPPSAMRKPQLVETLGKKFDEIAKGCPVFVNEELEECEETKPKIKPKKPKQKRRTKKGPSRRGRIVEEIILGIWDRVSLAEALNIENHNWKIDKNKTAIAGTMADLRSKGWTITIDKTNEIGRIIVEDC